MNHWGQNGGPPPSPAPVMESPTENSLRLFLFEIQREVQRQKSKHGEQRNLPDIESSLIAAEEVGEYHKEVNEVFYRGHRRTEMETELVEAAACLFRHWERSRPRRDSR
jgi:hypothetical protein